MVSRQEPRVKRRFGGDVSGNIKSESVILAPERTSIAGLMITTEAMVAELPMVEERMPGRHGHGSMGDMDMV